MRHLRMMPKGLGVTAWNWGDSELNSSSTDEEKKMTMMKQVKGQKHEVNPVTKVMMSIAWTL